MASQYSILRQYSPYVSPYNIDLIKEAMLYKQGKVDANRAAINQQIDYLMGQDLAKEEDREYLQNRVSDTLARVNEMYAGADLSSDGIARHIQSEVSTILDDNVINAVAGTAEMRRMQAHLEEMQKEHPELYSDMNAYVAMKPAMQWLNDGKAGTKLGPLNFTPYTDYNKELNDLMMDIRSKSGATKYFEQVTDSEGNPTGDIIEISRDAMSAEQVAAIAISGLSDKARRQMQIEAEFMADSNPEMFSYRNMLAYSQSEIQNQRQHIASLEAQKMGYTKGSTQYRMLESEINKAKSSLIKMENSIQSLTPENYNPIIGAQMVVETNFKNGAALKWAYDKTSYELKSDESYWNRLRMEVDTRNYNLQLAKFQFDMKKWQSEFEYGRQKDAYEAQRKERELGFDMSMEAAKTQSGIDLNNARAQKLLAEAATKGAGAGGDRAGSLAMMDALLAGTGYGVITRGEIKNLSSSDVNSQISKDFNDTYSKYNADILRLINNLDPEDVKKIDSYIAEQSKNSTSGYSGLSRADAYLMYFKQNKGLANEAFANAVNGQNGSMGPKIAQDAYLAAANGYQKLSIHNERIKEEGKVYKVLYDKLLNDRNNIVETAIGEAIKNNISVSNVPSTAGGTSNTYSHSSTSGVYTSTELADIDNTLTLIGDKIGYNAGDVYGIFGYDDVNNTYRLKDKNSIDSNDSLANWLYSGFNKYYNDSNALTRYRLDLGRDGAEELVNIRKKYLTMNIPNRLTISASNSKDTDYGAVLSARRLYFSKNGKSPKNGDIDTFNIEYSGIAENGELNYKITPVGTDLDEKNAVEVSLSELNGAGIMTNPNEQDIPIGSYNSGISRISFADPNDKKYVDLLETRNIPGYYASKPDIKNHFAEVITNRLTNSLSSTLNLMQGSLSADVSDTQAELLIDVMKQIIDNSEKLAIGVKGFDTKTENNYGYDERVYKLNPANPNARPEEILSIRKNGIYFADKLDEDMTIASQYRLSLILEEALNKAIDNMVRTGSVKLDEDWDLTKILNAVK